MSGLDFATAFPISSITGSITSWFSVFAPYIELILGVLLAFLIVNYLIRAITHQPHTDDDELLDNK
jgi:hypothetical protein